MAPRGITGISVGAPESFPPGNGERRKRAASPRSPAHHHSREIPMTVKRDDRHWRSFEGVGLRHLGSCFKSAVWFRPFSTQRKPTASPLPIPLRRRVANTMPLIGSPVSACPSTSVRFSRGYGCAALGRRDQCAVHSKNVDELHIAEVDGTIALNEMPLTITSVTNEAGLTTFDEFDDYLHRLRSGACSRWCSRSCHQGRRARYTLQGLSGLHLRRRGRDPGIDQQR